MHNTRREVLDESNRKRPAPVEPVDGLDTAKRQRLAVQPPTSGPNIASKPVPSGPPPVAPLPPGPVSVRQLYTLNAEGNAAAFDVQMFQDPEQLLRILVPVLQSIDEAKLGYAINVRDCCLHLNSPLSANCPRCDPSRDPTARNILYLRFVYLFSQ
jgi:symplekin